MSSRAVRLLIGGIVLALVAYFLWVLVAQHSLNLEAARREQQAMRQLEMERQLQMEQRRAVEAASQAAVRLEHQAQAELEKRRLEAEFARQSAELARRQMAAEAERTRQQASQRDDTQRRQQIEALRLAEERRRRETEEAERQRRAAQMAPCGALACTPVQIFFGTDREAANHGERIDFGGKRASQLQLGHAIVTVPRVAQRRVGEVLRPRWWERYLLGVPAAGLPEKHFTIPPNGVTAYRSPEEFLAAVQLHAQDAGEFKDHAFVFVHGYATSFEDGLYRAAQLTYDLGSDGRPFGTAFLYSWPSLGGMTDYKYDFDSARLAVEHLSAFVKLVVEQTSAKHVHLIAHSMGNWPLLESLARVELTEVGRRKLGQLLLAAPDIDTAEFERMAAKITKSTKGTTLYASSSDAAMMASRKVHGDTPRAGDIPVKGPVLLSGVDTIDISALSTTVIAFGHSQYAERRELLNDIALILRKGERPPPQRTPILQTVRHGSGEYWRFPP